MSVEVSQRGSLEVKTYGHSREVVRLVYCPLCGHRFEHRERRWSHFYEEHGPEDVPALSGEETVQFVPASNLYDPSDRSLTEFGENWLGRALEEPPGPDDRGLIPDGGELTNEGADPLEFPDLEEKFGHAIVSTAAHVLNRELLHTGQDLGRDDLIQSRIRGLDTPEEIAVYRAVESRTRNRERVHDLITERAEFLARNGYRPDDLVAALLDPEEELPERFRLRVPLWVCTDDLQDPPELEERQRSRPFSGSHRTTSRSLPSSSSRTSQASLAADGGRDR